MSIGPAFKTTQIKKLKNGENEVLQQPAGDQTREYYRLLRFREDGTLRRLQQLSISGTTLEEYDEEGNVETRIVNGMIEKSLFDEEEKEKRLTLGDVLQGDSLSSTLKARGGENGRNQQSAMTPKRPAPPRGSVYEG